jgi:hypothetical protein
MGNTMSSSPPADHFQPWFDPHIRLLQPQLPTLVGHQAFRERFARPLFALIPDLDGQVERSAIGDDCAYVDPTPLLRAVLTRAPGGARLAATPPPLATGAGQPTRPPPEVIARHG